MSTKPTEFCIGVPDAYDGSYETATEWLNAVRFYLIVNKPVYDTNEKQITFALSYMNKGSAATWASTFQQLAFASASTTLSLGIFDDFITKFKEFFKHTDTKGNAIAWLSTIQMVKDKKDLFHPSLTDYISSYKNNVALSGITDHNVLIQYFSSSISCVFMRQVYSMDTPPDTITAWYTKAIHFQTQWEQANLVAKQHDYPTKQSYYHAPSPPKPAKDPNAMVVDVIHITKMTPQE